MTIKRVRAPWQTTDIKSLADVYKELNIVMSHKTILEKASKKLGEWEFCSSVRHPSQTDYNKYLNTMLYQDDNVRRINYQKMVEIQATNDNHGASDVADIDHWLLGIWDFWLHHKVKGFRHRFPSKIESLGQLEDESLRYRTTEELPDLEYDHHLTPRGKKRRMEDVDASILRKRKCVQPMDATFDETLTLWIEHGKITIDQLEE